MNERKKVVIGDTVHQRMDVLNLKKSVQNGDVTIQLDGRNVTVEETSEFTHEDWLKILGRMKSAKHSSIPGYNSPQDPERYISVYPQFNYYVTDPVGKDNVVTRLISFGYTQQQIEDVLKQCSAVEGSTGGATAVLNTVMRVIERDHQVGVLTPNDQLAKLVKPLSPQVPKTMNRKARRRQAALDRKTITNDEKRNGRKQTR